MSPTLHPTSAADRAERAATWAARLADGPVPARQEKEFQAWLDADPLNGEALEEIVGAWRAVEHYAASPEMVALREAALASARRSSRRRYRTPLPAALSWTTSRRGLAAGLLAATLLVLVAGGLWASLSPRVYETGVGERRVVALSDGSKVSLDGATLVKVSYGGRQRRLWLERGRAKFDVAKDRTRPFSVAAANEVVVATGTAFSVELVQKQVRVVLYEGHVALLQRGSDGVRRTVALGATPADRLLTPGRQVILPEASAAQPVLALAVVERADPVRSLSWEAGQLVFEDEPLGVVAERMNRYAAKPLVIGNAAAASVRISGVFRAGDTDALIQGLAATFDVQARTTSDAITLFKNGAPASVG